MKLNFWQWLGVALLILGVIWYVMRERGERARTRSSLPTPAPAIALACPMNQTL
jgi:drug/metabolite transporter (DMT)-like permease